MNFSDPLVSVVMHSLNQAKFLDAAIQSVLGQNYSNIELIICDGGSTDSSIALLNSVQASDSRLRWFSEKNIGLAEALNKATRLARGTVIAWLNAGDVYAAGAVRRAVQAFANNPTWLMVYGHGQHMDECANPTHPFPTLPPSTPHTAFLQGSFICHSTVFFRLSTWLLVGDLDEKLPSAFDVDYWMRVFKAYPNRIGFIDELQAFTRLPAKSSITPVADRLIQPGEVMDRFSLTEHLQFADAYFAGRESHHYLYQKPFYHPGDCAPSLSNLGQLFAGVRLESGMRVLDFAAGSCWLSRILVQLGCTVTSCDASATALDIGKELFRKYPPIAESFAAPEFCVFDGMHLPFADGSFDRIIVNDAFHHVSNVDVVLAEFCRVLKGDGIVAMSEPGRYHSRTEASQYEMKTFNVIENDFVLEDVWRFAQEAGFKDIRVSPVLREPDLSMDEYLQCIQGKIPQAVVQGLVQGTINHSIFFLYKSPWRVLPKAGITAEVLSTRQEFDEDFYLDRNPDVAAGIGQGFFVDAWEHYEKHGREEGRAGRAK